MTKYDPSRPVGVFDSGLGGLTTVSELKRIMPHENIVYFGDTGRVPYGTKSSDTIRKYAAQDMRFLLSQNVKAVICACNTASTVITWEMAKDLGVPFFEVLTPAVNAAVKVTKNGKIGVICTSATVKSGAYEKALLALDSNLSITIRPCPLFVPLVENGYTNFDNEVTRLVAREYLAPIKQAGVDTLILGCTHYPILKDIISDIMGQEVTLIDSGAEVAAVAYEFLQKSALPNPSSESGVCSYFVSDDPADFTLSASRILKGEKIDTACKIDIDSESYVGLCP